LGNERPGVDKTINSRLLWIKDSIT